MAVGYTRLGNKPCLHPLLAVLAEAKLVAGFWLRPSNVVAFTLDLLSYLPSFIRLRVVRADSGSCLTGRPNTKAQWRQRNARDDYFDHPPRLRAC